MEQRDLERRFNFHPATQRTGPLHQSIRERCLQLAEFLNDTMDDSREKSVAITKLEEVMYWSNAAIARNSGESW